MKKEDLIDVLKISGNTLLTKHTMINTFAISDSYPEEAKKIMFFQNDYIKCYFLQIWLDMLEKEFGALVRKLSGKRNDSLNKKIGGVSTTAHSYKDLKAAIDFYMLDIDMDKVYKYIVKRFVFGECFYYRKKNFIHLTLPFKDNLMQYNIIG